MAPNSDFLNVPAFTYDVSTWLLHLEAVWAGVPDITDQQKYLAVVRALPSEVAARLSVVLAQPPTDDKYKALKSALTAAFGRTREAYFSELDKARFDGGRPSHLLARMIDLNRAAGQPLSEAMLRYRHTNLMPHPVRVQLAAVQQALSMAEYSSLVDGVYEAHMGLSSPPPGNLTCSCGAGSPTHLTPVPQSGSSVALLNIRARAAAGSDTHNSEPPPHNTTSTEARLSSMEASLRRLEAAFAGSPLSPRPGYCFYHRRFGADARNCEPPCAFPSQGNGLRGGR